MAYLMYKHLALIETGLQKIEMKTGVSVGGYDERDQATREAYYVAASNESIPHYNDSIVPWLLTVFTEERVR